MRINNVTITPVHTHSTHLRIRNKTFCIIVQNRHNHFRIWSIGNIDTTMQVPNYVTFYRPCFWITRRHIGTKRRFHKCQSMVINQVCSHRFSLCIFSYYQIAFDKELHTSFLIHRSDITNFFLRRYMFYCKFQIMYQHFKDGFLTGWFIVLLRNFNQFCNQRNITKQQYTMIVSISTMEISTTQILVA